MTSTKHLEDFRKYAYKDLVEIIDSSHAIFNDFLEILQNHKENIIAESRNNLNALKDNREDPAVYFKDLVDKVQSIRSDLFTGEKGHEVYSSLGISCQRDGDIPEKYAFRLLETIDFLIKHFMSRTSQECSLNISSESGRKTPFQSFILRNSLCINDLYAQMISFRFIIETETDKRNFANSFIGATVKPQIQWHGDFEELRYFILRIVKEKLVMDLGKDHWLVACKCFCFPDGTQFTVKRFRTNHTPKDKSKVEVLLSTIRSG